MERFGSILAVLSDGVMPAHVHALSVALARADRAALTFVDVIDSDAASPADAETAARRARLAEAVAAAELAGIAASEAVVRGQTAVEVIRMVLREGHDLVLYAADGPGGTAARLLADCPSPVWLVADARPEAVIAVLPTGADGDGERVAAMARALSVHLGLEVTRVAASGAVAALRDGHAAVVVLVGRDAGLVGDGSVLAIKPEGFVSPVTLEAVPQDGPQDGTARRATGRAAKG